MYDVAIIGGGVVACSLAYLLSRYELKVIVLEKENDLSQGASKANSAIIHAGYDPAPGSLMAELNRRGVELCAELVRRLDVEYKRTGSLVVALSEEDEAKVEALYHRGIANEIPEVEIIGKKELNYLEENISDKINYALYAPTAGVINPWDYTLAMGETAWKNGVEISLNSKVIEIEKMPDGFEIFFEYAGEEEIHNKAKTAEEASLRSIKAEYAVNAAGVYADKIHAMLDEPRFSITPTRGEYYILDREMKDLVNTVIFQTPGKHGKGVLIAPTVHENVIIGPNAEEIEDPDDVSTTAEALDYIAETAKLSIPSLDIRGNIKNFAGLRANADVDDFVIEMAIPGFLDLAAIKSPGLSAAPAIAEKGLEILKDAGLKLKAKNLWDGGRRVTRFRYMSPQAQKNLIDSNKDFGRIICRCETITEGEIREAIRRSFVPRSLDAIKRRCGTGAGRCQGGFCGPRVLEIIADETNCKPEEVLQNRKNSYVLTGETKGGDEC